MARQLRRPLLLVAGAAALACAPLTTASASSTAVSMQNYAFSMPVLQVAVGDTVTWTNQDRALHDATTTKAPVAFASPELKTGESWSYTFTQPGVYSYECALHPKMIASITAVGPAPTPAKSTPTPTLKGAAKADAKATTTAAAAKHASATPTPSPTPAATPDPASSRTASSKTATSKAGHAISPLSAADRPAAVTAPAITAAPAAAAPVLSGNDLNLTPELAGGGVAVAVAVLGLLAYGFTAGRRTG